MMRRLEHRGGEHRRRRPRKKRPLGRGLDVAGKEHAPRRLVDSKNHRELLSFKAISSGAGPRQRTDALPSLSGRIDESMILNGILSAASSASSAV